MIVSTRGRYALQVMTELAEMDSDGYVPMKEIAARQNLSLKYLEQILPLLTKDGLIEGLQGKKGGYRLCRKPEEYTIGEILRRTEGDFAPVSCLEGGGGECSHGTKCRTHPVWTNLQKLIGDYFDGITLADLLDKNTDNAEKDEK